MTNTSSHVKSLCTANVKIIIPDLLLTPSLF